VFEAARKAGVKKIVATSSCAVYGATDKSPLTEKLSPQPLTPYGASKLAMEYYLDFYNQRYGIQTVALRLANIYGPRQESSLESGAVAVFTNRLLAGQQVYLNDDGQTVRDYLYVSEVVSGLMAAAQSQDSSIYNLGTKVGTTTQALYTLISGYLNSKLQPIPRPEVKDAAKVAIVKAAKAKQGLDWKSKIGLKRGLKATIKWYQDRH
jgi:UDP-glucose 4-epimerase